MRRVLRTLTVFAILLNTGAVLAPRPAPAHQLKVFATAEGAEIQGYAYFPGGGRAADLPVTVLGPDDKKLGETRTDAEGRFEFHAQTRCDHRFVVDTGTGHRAHYTVEAAELSSDLPGESPAAESAEVIPPVKPTQEAASTPEETLPHPDLRRMIERAVSRQIRPLREDLEAYHSRARLHEVIGEIGRAHV